MELLLTSLLAFVSTNIDDIFLLMLFFGSGYYKTRDIVIGQFIGIGTLIVASLLLSLIGLIIAKEYIGVLGLLPIYFGIKGLLSKNAKDVERDGLPNPASSRNTLLTVSGVTIANGGDNIGIYAPLFVTLTWAHKLSMIAIFLLMTGIWCLLANYITKHPLVAKTIDTYGHRITPFVLILLGLYILYQSNTLSLIVQATT